MKDFATVAEPLHMLKKKNACFHWTTECQIAFNGPKQLLATAPMLGYPFDHSDRILDTDASNVSIGAVLSQFQQAREWVL